MRCGNFVKIELNKSTMLTIEQIPAFDKVCNNQQRGACKILYPCELPRRLLGVTGIASGTSGWRELKQDWPSATTTQLYTDGAVCIECCSVSADVPRERNELCALSSTQAKVAGRLFNCVLIIHWVHLPG